MILNENYITVPATYNHVSTPLGKDEYYVLGDNRPKSADSHVFGPVKAEKIKGKVID